MDVNEEKNNSDFQYDHMGLQRKPYEFCPRCEANLTFQKGYDNTLPYWICLGCGEMLINPELNADSDIIWLCDECGALLNIQEGFDESLGEWHCTECDYLNKIDSSELYESEDEYQADIRNPYKGLSDEDALELSVFQDEECIDGRPDVIVVKHNETGKKYIKKFLTIYDKSVYAFLFEHPLAHMPRIYSFYESMNCLIVIEEYIEGMTVESLLSDALIPASEAVRIAMDICYVLKELHSLTPPLVHRDIKPSNVILNSEKEVFLLDINVAKWHDPNKSDDTKHMGTQNYAAPEQVGYGLSASSPKSDIYALGMLLNVMITGRFPKEERAPRPVWDIIKRCINLEADLRYSEDELIEELGRIEGV